MFAYICSRPSLNPYSSPLLSQGSVLLALVQRCLLCKKYAVFGPRSDAASLGRERLRLRCSNHRCCAHTRLHCIALDATTLFDGPVASFIAARGIIFLCFALYFLRSIACLSRSIMRISGNFICISNILMNILTFSLCSQAQRRCRQPTPKVSMIKDENDHREGGRESNTVYEPRGPYMTSYMSLKDQM